MKRPWEVVDAERERKAHRRLHSKAEDRRRRGVKEGGDSGSGLAYDRRVKGRRDSAVYRSESFGSRRDFFPKGFRSEREERQRRDGRSWVERHRLSDKHGRESREEGEVKEEEMKEGGKRESFGVTSDSEMEEGELEPEPETQIEERVEESSVDLEKKGEQKEKTEDFCEAKDTSEKEENFNGDSDSGLKKDCEDGIIGEKIAMEEEEGEEENVEKKESSHQEEKEQKTRENTPIENEIQKERENAPTENEIQTEEIEEKEAEEEQKGDEEQNGREHERGERSSNGETETRPETETEKNNKPLSYKDKGKGKLALESPVQNEKEDSSDQMEISSSKRGLDLILFRSESSKLKAECSSKSKEDLKNYCLDLSLSLPGVSSDSQFTQNPNPSFSPAQNSSENHEHLVKSRFLFQPVQEEIKNDRSKSHQLRNPNSSQTLISRNPSFSKPKTSVIERVLYKIANEPLNLLSRMLLEMKENSISYLKQAIREIISNSEKKTQLNSLKHAIQSRPDLTADNLLKCPRPLLEILTVLKTSLTSFFNNNNNNNVATSDLVEILCNRKCRNSECGNEIPVSNCDCKTCTSNPGFCNSCMCIVCSDFDSSFNTCSWVGCDSCMHWCHTNCALNNNLIKPGIQIPDLKPGIGIPDFGIRFLCEGCGHANEMFGFVKEVFRTCCEVWESEVLVRELGFVERIFEASEDFRERKLRDLAGKMMEVLANDRSNHARVVSYVLGFLNDAESSSNMSRISTVQAQKDQFVNTIGTKENSNSWILNNKNPIFDVPEQKPVPVLDDLEKIIKLKKAEAKMYQEKSNYAKKEAEGLKRIIYSKNKKIDEEYYDKINRIKLRELEERRKRRFEEFRVLEKEYKMFFGVKVGMESEIRDLMLKLEGAKRNFR